MLPELRLPAGLPCFLVQGHRHALVGPYDDLPMQSGPNRRRRVFTTMPREVDVQAIYTASQAAAFRAWWEGIMQAGARHFAAHVRHIGPGMRWWDAAWIAPWTMEAMHEGRWRLSGRLRLYGAPSIEPPALSSMQASISVNVDAAASINVGRFLAASISVNVDASAAAAGNRDLAASIIVDFEASA